jgi:hypothetical protein
VLRVDLNDTVEVEVSVRMGVGGVYENGMGSLLRGEKM